MRFVPVIGLAMMMLPPLFAGAAVPPESGFIAYRVAGDAFATADGLGSVFMDPLLSTCLIGGSWGNLEGVLLQRSDAAEAELAWSWTNHNLPCATAHACALRGDLASGWMGDCGEKIFYEDFSLQRPSWGHGFVFDFRRSNTIMDGVWVWAGRSA